LAWQRGKKAEKLTRVNYTFGEEKPGGVFPKRECASHLTPFELSPDILKGFGLFLAKLCQQAVIEQSDGVSIYHEAKAKARVLVKTKAMVIRMDSHGL